MLAFCILLQFLCYVSEIWQMLFWIQATNAEPGKKKILNSDVHIPFKCILIEKSVVVGQGWAAAEYMGSGNFSSSHKMYIRRKNKQDELKIL